MFELFKISKLSYDETTEIINYLNEWLGIILTRRQVKRIFGKNEELAQWMKEFGLKNVIFDLYLLDLLCLDFMGERAYHQLTKSDFVDKFKKMAKLKGFKVR